MTREVNWVPVRYLIERLAKTLWPPIGRLSGIAGARWTVPATLFDVLGLYAIRTGEPQV